MLQPFNYQGDAKSSLDLHKRLISLDYCASFSTDIHKLNPSASDRWDLLGPPAEPVKLTVTHA